MTDKKEGLNAAEAKLVRMIGLAAKAGRIRSGGLQTETSVRSGRAALCLLAKDASEAAKKEYKDMCRHKQVPVYETAFAKETLGHMIGRGERSAFTVEDRGFAETMIRLMEKGGNACDE